MPFQKFSIPGDNNAGFVFSPTSNIDCCNINSLGYQCSMDSSIDLFTKSTNSPTDEFGSFDAWQTFFLVITNLPLLLAAFKCVLLKNWSRFFLNIAAMFASILYHLCKTKVPVGGICLLDFCTLKNLDYSFSNTLLISLLFFIFSFVIEEEEEGGKGGKPIIDNIIKEKNTKISSLYEDELEEKKEQERESQGIKIIREFQFIEGFILVSYAFGIFIILDSTFFCSGEHTLLLFLIIIGSALIITIPGHFIVVRWIGVTSLTKYNITNSIIGYTLAFFAVLFFIIEDFMDKRYYWITHSIWHLLAAFSQIFLLDARSKTRTGCYALCFICVPV